MKRYPKRARPLWGSPPRVPFAQVVRRAWARRSAAETASAAYWMSGDALFTLPSIHENGPRASADGMTAGGIGVRAGVDFAASIAAGIVLSHGTPLAAPIALAVEQARTEEALAVRLRVAEQAAGLPAGTLKDEEDLRRAMAGRVGKVCPLCAATTPEQRIAIVTGDPSVRLCDNCAAIRALSTAPHVHFVASVTEEQRAAFLAGLSRLAADPETVAVLPQGLPSAEDPR